MKSILFVVLSLLSLAGCAKTDDEAEIRRIVATGVTLAEARDVKGLLSLTTDRFTAHPGARDRREVSLTLLMAFRQYGKFTISHPAYDVELFTDAGEASVNLPFIILREGKDVPGVRELVNSPQEWVQQAAQVADPYYLSLSFAKDDGTWKVSAATLRGIRSAGF
mgnify:FL=1